jgi:hypothetical protein
VTLGIKSKDQLPTGQVEYVRFVAMGSKSTTHWAAESMPDF